MKHVSHRFRVSSGHHMSGPAGFNPAPGHRSFVAASLAGKSPACLTCAHNPIRLRFPYYYPRSLGFWFQVTLLN
eukprot:scaffold26143_cov60-Phaeocystis_antarctica.AAC.3